MKTLQILCLVACVGALAASCSRDPQVLRDTHFQKGETYFKEGKLEEAVDRISDRLAVRPTNGRRLLPAWRDLPKSKRIASAAFQAYIRAADLLPTDIEAHLRAANYLDCRPAFEDARTMALKAVQLDPKNVEALILVGNASAGLNNLERAIEELQAAQKLDATDPRIYNNLGWFEALRGRSDQAEAVFRNAVAAAPKSAAAHLALANYLSATGRRDEAEKSLRTAVAVEPTHVPALRAIGWFLTMTNRAKEAEPFLVDAARHDPKPDSRILLADFYVWSGRDADAVRVLEQVKSTGPGSVIADTRLASILYRTDRPRAESLVKAVLASHPQNVDAQLLSAQLAFDARKLTEAMSAIEALIKQYPRLAQAHFLQGRVLLELGRFTRGEPKPSTRWSPSIPGRSRRVSTSRDCSSSATRWRAARQIANEVLQLAPGNPAARLAIVETDRASGEWAAANRQIADLVRSYPDWSPVHYEAARLASLRNRTGRRRGKRWTASRRWMLTRGKLLKDGLPWTWARKTSRSAFQRVG